MGKTLQERLAERRAAKVETRVIPGLGTIQVKRLTMGEVRDLADSDYVTQEMMVAALLDDEGKPIYKSVKEVLADDFGIARALQKACDEVNTISEVKALGN